MGLLLLDSLLHCPGQIDFSIAEVKNWGLAAQDTSILLKKLTQCDRVYTIVLGEGAQ